MAARTNSAAPRSNRVLIISLTVIVTLVAVLVAGELYVRHNVKTCMADQFESQLGSQVDVGLSWKPVLLQSIDKNTPYITIDSDDTRFGPAEGMQVHARINDIRIEDNADSSGTIGSSEASVNWSTEGILTTLQQQTFGSLISGVTADSNAGTLKFDVGPAGLAGLTVKPTVSNGTVDVETVGAEILGFGLPTDLVDGIVQTLTSSLQTYPLGMQPTSLQVTDDAINITLDGGPYTMPPADTAAQQQQQQSSCGILL
ncbi:hypothetical protein BFN03_12850 [Rhodococcus sp. WMMA185]|uniref:LmeA family phospholipid-binding protein n=1 Tax=Rhodococcus sp. WMMA185 TaxID=679318 RepID=UPI0008783C25|nr:DUF2993 domain-containing protein [Rhodococcus sp. WMMA185]AOW93235.1 hypothetical protein BFN03_12850 [Rhodococcus sp. WMMA185]